MKGKNLLLDNISFICYLGRKYEDIKSAQFIYDKVKNKCTYTLKKQSQENQEIHKQ